MSSVVAIVALLACLCAAGGFALWRFGVVSRERAMAARFVKRQMQAAGASGAPGATPRAESTNSHSRVMLEAARAWTVLVNLMRRAGVRKPRVLIAMTLGVAACASLWAGSRAGAMFGLGVALFVFVAIYAVLSWCAQKRHQRITRQLPPFLDGIVRLIVIGHSVPAAFQATLAGAEAPLRECLDRALPMLRTGMEIDHAMAAVARMYRVRELELVGSVLRVSVKYGALGRHARPHGRLDARSRTGRSRTDRAIDGNAHVVVGPRIAADRARRGGHRDEPAVFRHDVDRPVRQVSRLCGRRLADDGRVAVVSTGEAEDMNMTPNLLAVAALAIGSVAAALSGAIALSRYGRMQRSVRPLDQALNHRAAPAAPSPDNAANEVPTRGLIAAIGRASAGWLDTPVGCVAVALEDGCLLERCGYMDARARGFFLAARIAGAFGAPLVLALAHVGAQSSRWPLYYFIAIACGFMAPKWFVRRKAAARQQAVSSELPMFVDLLHLLQGVGLSLDQSLQVMIHDFSNVLPVLARELAMAQAQFVTGRTREQSLKRLATSYENEDLAAVVRLIIQVEQHGGVVQEPLRQFGDRLRERIGKLTVKMTGVMVVTLLLALLIVTAGPGFIAISHSLSNLHR